MDSGFAALRRPGMTNMQWTDEAIVLGVKRHGETSVILELLTQTRGRHLGLVRGGSGTRLRGVLQPGNSLRAFLSAGVGWSPDLLFRGAGVDSHRSSLFFMAQRFSDRTGSVRGVPPRGR